MTMKISMSLYGENPKYLQGAIENARLRKIIYPEWTLTVFHDQAVPKEILDELALLSVELIAGETLQITNPMMWRFYPVFTPGFKRVIIRDSDSRFSQREARAVEEWVNSGKSLHIMRDHPMHDAPILGGMWGLQGITPALNEGILLSDLSRGEYGSDQLFLAREIYSRFKKDSLVHDEYFCFEKSALKFPDIREKGAYIGESFEADGKVNLALRVRLPDRRIGTRIRSAQSCLKTRIKLILKRYSK
jgi:hypothetical protein